MFIFLWQSLNTRDLFVAHGRHYIGRGSLIVSFPNFPKTEDENSPSCWVSFFSRIYLVIKQKYFIQNLFLLFSKRLENN